MTSFDSFQSEWLGKRCDFDRIFSYQCVDLILQGLYEMYDLSGGISGNATDYWNKTGVANFNQKLLTKFLKVPSSEALKGDIVVLNGLSGNPYGHIGWATGNINASDVEILEQNGATGKGTGTGGDAIRTRWIPKSRIAGLLRPIANLSTPVVTYTPPTGNFVHLPASVQSWAVYKVGSGLRKGTSDQLGSLAPGRFGGLSYAIVQWVGDYGVVIDTESYGRVAIWTKGTSAEFSTTAIASSAPVARASAPSAPLFATNDEQYEVVKTVKGYLTALQAINHTGSTAVEIPAGTYFVFNKQLAGEHLQSVNVTKTAGKPGAWVNTADNIADPTPEELAAIAAAKQAELDAAEAARIAALPPFASSYVVLPEPLTYVVMREGVQCIDPLNNYAPVNVARYSIVKISGSFSVNGISLARLKSAADKDLWFAIRWSDDNGLANLKLESEVYGTKTTLEDRKATNTLTKADHAALVYQHISHFMLGFIQLLSKIKVSKVKK